MDRIAKMLLSVAMVVLVSHAVNASARQGEAHQISVGFGMYAAGYASASWGDAKLSGGGALPPDALCFTLPVEYRYRVSDWFAAGANLSLLVWHLSGAGTTGGALLGGGIRPYLVPDWLYFDLSVFFGFPLLYGWMPKLGLTIPVSDSASIMIENQLPMTHLFGTFLMIYQPVVGVEFAF